MIFEHDNEPRTSQQKQQEGEECAPFLMVKLCNGAFSFHISHPLHPPLLATARDTSVYHHHHNSRPPSLSCSESSSNTTPTPRNSSPTHFPSRHAPTRLFISSLHTNTRPIHPSSPYLFFLLPPHTHVPSTSLLSPPPITHLSTHAHTHTHARPPRPAAHLQSREGSPLSFIFSRSPIIMLLRLLFVLSPPKEHHPMQPPLS